jgi:hypothetical protein
VHITGIEILYIFIFFIPCKTNHSYYYLTTLRWYDLSQILVLQVLAEKYKPPLNISLHTSPCP